MHLCIGYSILRLWLRKYKDEGIHSYTKVPARGKPQCLVTSDIHKSLENKLRNSANPLQSYLEAVSWVEEMHGVKLGITHFENI